MLLCGVFLVCVMVGFSLSVPPGQTDPAQYGLEIYGDSDMWHLNPDEVNYDYDDLDGEIEVGTLAPPTPLILHPALVPPEDATLPPHSTKPPAMSTLDFRAPGLFGPETGLGMPSCLLCVCLSGSVYCDDSELIQIPPLPKDTTHFYARFNKITEVKAKDFLNLNQLKKIDLSGNKISKLHKDSFRSLSQLQDLIMADNSIQSLPELPASLRHIDLRNNQLRSLGLHTEHFKDMKELQFLYLSDNKLDYIPVPLPDSLRALHLQNNNVQSIMPDTFCNSHDRNYIRKELEDIRLDGNPLDVNLYPQAYVCLPRIPVGSPV